MIPTDVICPPIDKFHSVITPILEIMNASSIVQIGASSGELTEKLLYWVESRPIPGSLVGIDVYSWNNKAQEIIESSPCGKWISELSENALPSLPAADIYVIDNDYNYYTVTQELQKTWLLNQNANKPFLTIIRGSGTPFSRRDAYNNPEAIPEKYLQPHSWTKGIFIEDQDILLGKGLQFESMALATKEGGDCNGVLTAIWDFLADKKNLKKVNIPVFFGLEIIFSTDATWSNDLIAFLKSNHTELAGTMEEQRFNLISETCWYQQEIEEKELNQQNHYFDTTSFFERMANSEGKKSGLGVVSIIIPTYNRPKLLTEAIKSVLQQTYKDIEVIVVNDAGEDIQSVIDSFQDKRIIYRQHSANKGLPATRNTGIKQASGKYIAYLDDDDRYHPENIEYLINSIHESGFKVAYTDTYQIVQREKENKFITLRKKYVKLKSVSLESILVRNKLFPLCICHEKDCLTKVGLFDETLNRHEDWELWIRMAQDYPFLHLPIPLSDYITTTGYNRTMTSWNGAFLNTALIIHNRYRHLAKHSYLVAAQTEFRNILRYSTLLQLRQMSDTKLEKIFPSKIMTEILANSLRGTRDDILGARAIIAYLEQRMPNEKQLQEIDHLFAKVL